MRKIMAEKNNTKMSSARRSETEESQPSDRIQVLMSEQALLDMIRTGNMEYHTVPDKARLYLVGRGAFSPDPLQNTSGLCRSSG